jgi:hypothetical protein
MLVTVPDAPLPASVHAFDAVQMFNPYVAPAVVTKYCWPTAQLAGSDAPMVTKPAPTTHKPG